MIDIGLITKILKNPSDLPSAAKALGMEHSTIAPEDAYGGTGNDVRLSLLRVAFQRLADAAQKPGSEVIELAGAPSLLKGKRVRILAVLEDEQPEELQAGAHYKAVSN